MRCKSGWRVDDILAREGICVEGHLHEALGSEREGIFKVYATG